MRIGWRLTRPPHSSRSAAFGGEGARLFGGRWNSPGASLVYASTALSLACLETLVHADRRRFEREYVAYRFEVEADDVRTLAETELPASWRERPLSLEARALGDAWLRNGTSLVLSVPSVVVPLERNLLLNPAHPRFDALEISEAIPFRFDDRLTRP